MTQQVRSVAPALRIRRFSDCVGDRWTVYCITPPSLLERALTLLPHGERRRGWLLFESADGERRRLSHIPADWASITDFELERWCMRATRVEHLPRRRAEDNVRPSTGESGG